MRTHKRKRHSALLAVALILAISAVAGGCQRSAKDAESARPRVVVSIEPLALMVREVAGDLVSSSTLLPAGADPHHYEVRPRQIAELTRADLIVVVGGGFDRWAERLCEECAIKARSVRLVDLPGIDAGPAESDVHAHDHAPDGDEDGAVDPHVWLDPLRVRDVIVPALVAELSALAPAHRGAFESGGRHLAENLSALDREVRALFRGRDRRFVALHPAWHYFAARYALEQHAVLAPISGINPSAKALADTIRACRANAIATLVLEVRDARRRGAAIAEALGVKAVTLNPLGPAPESAGGSAPRALRLSDLYLTNAKRLAAAMPDKRELR